jgi:Xaa-Pro aminopeptidase
MDYGHGTGHGIGYYLSVHESPASIGQGTSRVTDEPLDIGMVESDGLVLQKTLITNIIKMRFFLEPGYYQEGQFGIRLETDVEVVRAKVSNVGYLNKIIFNLGFFT